MRYFHPAKANELQCDLDSSIALKTFWKGIQLIRASKHLNITKISVRRSLTRNHYHGRVWLTRSLPVMERVTLQLTLGDDPIRGLMNWGRVRNRDPHPILLIDRHASDTKCNCTDTRRLPRCPHIRALQTSRAEFLAR
jgi:hypothetical protein